MRRSGAPHMTKTSRPTMRKQKSDKSRRRASARSAKATPAKATTKSPKKSSKKRPGRPIEAGLAELKARLREIGDLEFAGAVLGWDQATYMPQGGAAARGRQAAMLSRMAHEKSVDPRLGKLSDEIEPRARLLPDESDDRSLIRFAQRDFAKAIKVPPG